MVIFRLSQKNDLIKDLNSIKYNFTTVENHANQAKTNLNLSWQEQNFISGVSDIVNVFLFSSLKSREYGAAMELLMNQELPAILPLQPN